MMRLNSKLFSVIFIFLWTAALLGLGGMVLQQRVQLTLVWQTIPIPRQAIHASPRSGEHTYKVQLADLGLIPGEPRLSALTLMEDGVPLDQPDSGRRNTAQKGLGRYLIWEDALQFSSRDNTSPLNNGRAYQVRLPAHVSLQGLAICAALLLLGTLILLRYLPAFRRFLGMALFDVLLLAGLCYGFEALLKASEPRQPASNGKKYPYDSNYAQINPAYYQDTALPYAVKTKEYTWGVLVDKNRLGFREREIDVPKPADTCRIMVLGDSLTWGVGLKPEERYSNLLEEQLQAAFPQRKIEVLNFGVRGYSTVRERDTLRTYVAAVDPNWVLVGFCKNDPQPRSEDYRREKELFDQRVLPYISPVFQAMETAGFPHIARTSRTALDAFLSRTGIIPSAEEGLQRTYEPASAEWQAFTGALEDIHSVSETRGLPSPLFAVLNQSVESRGDGDYLHDGPDLPLALRQTRQAERAAADAGLLHTNMEKEILEKVRPQDMHLNPLDAHPSARANQVYAQKLFEIAATEIRAGRVCPPGK